MIQNIPKIQKRSGDLEDFKKEKIKNAVFKALTATNEGGHLEAEKIADEVERILNLRFDQGQIPQIEQIQDIVEEVLMMNDYLKTARAFILYRDQRRRIRDLGEVYDEAVEIYDQYISEMDWQVKENANMAYSLQGLNNYGVSSLSKRYWLNKIYPKNIRDGLESGDFHLHDLDVLGAYCCGWDLYDLLIRGFGGVRGKVECSPAKHLRSALGQIVNFLYTLQGESAGAQAMSNFDTLLAPFIRYDNLNYGQVKECLQSFLFNCAVPTRVGFQCLSQDTEILTPNGWQNHQTLKESDTIYTFNLKTKELEPKKVDFIFRKEYQGKMYNLTSRSQDQLISPNHRVVRNVFNTERYILEPIEKVLTLKSSVAIPVSGENINPDYPIKDEQLKFLAWVLSEGSIEKDGSKRVSIYQSPEVYPKNYQEIIDLLDYHNFSYTETKQTSLGTCSHIRLLPSSSKVVREWLTSDQKKFPDFIFQLSKRQARLFLETYIKGDGWQESYRSRITTTEASSLEALQGLAVLSGYNFSTLQRMPQGIAKKLQYVLSLTETKNDYIVKIREVNYRGVIWSVHTQNETVVAKRNGQVFITGNTPFSNITLDLNPSPSFAKMPVIIGGKPQKETYSEFQAEMDILNKAFYEVVMEGDKNGRIFTFPIPTVNITKDFDWQRPNLEPLWQATAKYGVNYFANFIQSDMNPEDVRSMCLSPKEEIIVRSNKGIERLPIKVAADLYKEKEFDVNGWAEVKKETDLEVLSFNPKTWKSEWVNVERFFKKEVFKKIEVLLEDGKKAVFSEKHPCCVYTKDGLVMKWAKDLKKDDYVFSAKNLSNNLPRNYQRFENLVLNEKLAALLGYFIADGNYLFENRKGFKNFGKPKGIQFTFKTGDYVNIREIKKIILELFGYQAKEKQDPRYNTFYLYFYNVEIARKLYDFGFKKYGRLPQVIFNSPVSVIKSFLTYYFKGDGYAKRGEIHINDLDLSRDLVWLYNFIGSPTTYRLRKQSQVINLQQSKKEFKVYGAWLNNPILAERAPAFLAQGSLVPSFSSDRMIGFATLTKYQAHTTESLKAEESDFYLTRVREVKRTTLNKKEDFFDIELAKNHLFVHSLGVVSFNCCRLRLSNKELLKKGGGLFGANPQTGSVGVVTINMPRIGYLSKTRAEFFERLVKVMDLAKDSLEIKRKAVEDFMEKGLYPYSKYYLANVKIMRGSYYGNHFSTIGLLGMNECLLNFMGETIASSNGRNFALEVLKIMKERIITYQEQTGNLYNLESTPAEGASYRLALKDKKLYPRIITAGTTETPYYTNSSQLPVNYTDDVFEALDLQDDLQCSYTGGTVAHLFLGERLSDIETVKHLVKTVFTNYKLPYITLTPTFSICPVHGYLSGEHWQCPQCMIEQPCEVYSRVVGYLRPVQQWHKGKAQEFKERKVFALKRL